MLNDKLLDFIKAYIDDAVEKALEERGLPRNKQTKKQAYSDNFEAEWDRKFEEYKRQKQQGADTKQENQYKKTTDQQNNQKKQENYQQKAQPTADLTESKHYQALEIPYGATFEQIKSAYKFAMKKYHPDNFTYNEKKRLAAEKIAQKINEAYEYFKKKHNKK